MSMMKASMPIWPSRPPTACPTTRNCTLAISPSCWPQATALTSQSSPRVCDASSSCVVSASLCTSKSRSATSRMAALMRCTSFIWSAWTRSGRTAMVGFSARTDADPVSATVRATAVTTTGGGRQPGIARSLAEVQ
jgi:hypothetical protein